VQLPVGSSLAQTDRVLAEIEDTLRRDKRVRLVTAFVGTSSPRFHTLYAPKFPSRNYGQLVVVTESNDATIELLDEYSVAYENRYPNADILWRQLELSPSKAPIEVRISGDSLRDITAFADSVVRILRAQEGTGWVRSDYKQKLQTVDLDVNRDEASRLGASATLLGYSLMVGTRGLPVATIWEGDDPIGVTLRTDKRVKTDVRDIEDQYVTLPFLASSIQLRQLAAPRPGWTEGEIVRRNGVRTVTVLAEIERDRFAADVFNAARPAIEALALPEDVEISYGGEYSDSREYISPLFYALATSIVIIFLILMFQFRSVKTSLLIMSTMPLCLFGAAFGVFVAGYPFSVTAFIGLIGLIGIVVRNGIIYVSTAEDMRRRHSLTLAEAALLAAKRRLRPIFLTCAAAAVGVIPMILSRSSLWGPLGSVVCFGLMFGMILSLLVVPILYYAFHRRDFEKTEEEVTA
jgi:multidrug efflux pump subunit AcrB